MGFWYFMTKNEIMGINPFVTSGTYMSHSQIVFTSPLGYQYPTSSPCCHLPWTISTPWKQSECIFPRNMWEQMVLSAVLHGWLAVMMYFEPILSVFQWDKRGKCIYIICVVIYDAFTCVLPFYIWEYFPGNGIFYVCNVPFLPIFVFGLAVCISGLFFPLEFHAVRLPCTS